MRDLLIDASQYDIPALIKEWRWLLPPSDTPLFLSAFGDWVLGNRDGSLWVLSLLEGTYECVARGAAEYNKLNKSEEWLDKVFIAGWLSIAVGRNLVPAKDECLGWKLHPLLGGGFEVMNLQIFSMRVYQSLMGQLHYQVRNRRHDGR